MNELNKLYQAMCLSWGAQIKDAGQIVFVIDGQEFPLKIDNMTLHLPLSEVLDGPCVDKVFFHPACENITSKETEVFKIIRRMSCMKLMDNFRRIPMVLFTLASGKPKAAWNQKTLDMLEPLKNAKRTVRDELNALFARMHIEVEENGLDNRFIHFRITKGGGTSRSSGQKVYYKTRPEFPFYTEIVRRLARSEGQADNQTIELNNHSVSRAALKLAAHLFQTILPAVNNPSDYEFEATTPIAARLISYLGAYSEIADQLNKVQNTFRTEFDKVGLYTIDLNWTEWLENLPETYRQVPMMDYNSHQTHDETSTQAGGRNDMGGLLSVTSGGQGAPGQPAQAGTMVGDYDTSPPQMQAGDRYVKCEIDYTNNRVLHHAINQMNMPVMYICSKRGNMLQRQEVQGYGPATNFAAMASAGLPQGSQFLPNGMILLPNGVQVTPAQLGINMPMGMHMGAYPQVQPTATMSVFPDQGSYGGGYGGGGNGYPGGGGDGGLGAGQTW